MAFSFTEQRVSQDAHDLEAFWRKRNERIKAWYTLRRLVDRWKEPGKTSYVSNFPKVYFNLARRLMAGNPARPRVLMGEDSLEERHLGSISERGVQSIFRQLDERHIKQGRLPWRYEMADQICMGWLTVFRGVFQNPDDPTRPEFRADIWDNMTVYPEWDEDGLATVLHMYDVTPRVAQEKARRFDVILRNSHAPVGGSVRVADWWRRQDGAVWHAMTIDGEDIIPIEEMPGLTELPILILPVNGEARRNAMRVPFMEDPTVYMGVSILDLIERTINDTNDWLTMIKQITQDNVHPNRIDYTEDGQGFLNADDMRRGGGVHHAMQTDRVETLPPPQIPAQAQMFVGIMDLERQMGSVPNTAFANVAADTSGFLFAQLQAAALTNIGPYVDAQNFALTDIAQTFIEGFRDGGFKPITIKGRARNSGHESGYFFEDWDPKDIRKDIWVGVTTELAILRNRVQELAALRQALPGSQALLDETTALDEIAGFDDPLLIQERKHEDAVRNSPENLLVEKIKFHRQQIDLAKQRDDRPSIEAHRIVLRALLTQAGIGQQQNGQGAPVSEPGIPPEGGVMARNGQSPDMMQAMLQRTPPQAAGQGAGR